MKKFIAAILIALLLTGLLTSVALAQTDPPGSLDRAEPTVRRPHDHIGNFNSAGGKPGHVVIVPLPAATASPVFKIVSGVVDTSDGEQVFFLFPDEPRFRPPEEVLSAFCSRAVSVTVSVEVIAALEFLRVQTALTADEVERVIEQLGWLAGRTPGWGNYW